jgi:hypothetical protein
VNRAQYETSLKGVASLKSTTHTLRTYSGQPIACLGCIEFLVSLGDVRLPLLKFYVTAKGDSVLGVDRFDSLGGIVQMGYTSLVSQAAVGVVLSSPSMQSSLQPPPSSIQSPPPSSSKHSLSYISLADYLALTTGPGKLKGFVHRPKMDPSVRPVQQRFYHHPLALR